MHEYVLTPCRPLAFHLFGRGGEEEEVEVGGDGDAMGVGWAGKSTFTGCGQHPAEGG